MPKRTVSAPGVNDSFLWRVCKALDEPPRMLAANMGVPYEELAPLLDERHKLAEIDRDEVWWKLAEYVDRRMGLILAVRSELNKALQQDRQRRAVRQAAMKQRTGKGSPRGKRQNNSSQDV